MLVRHATPLRNLRSIQRVGLLCSRSHGRLPLVWLHSPGLSRWAVLHTIERHGGRVQDVVTVELGVARGWLRRSRKGLWYCPRDLPPDCLRRFIAFQELAGASTDARPGPERRTC